MSDEDTCEYCELHMERLTRAFELLEIIAAGEKDGKMLNSEQMMRLAKDALVSDYWLTA